MQDGRRKTSGKTKTLTAPCNHPPEGRLFSHTQKICLWEKEQFYKATESQQFTQWMIYCIYISKLNSEKHDRQTAIYSTGRREE